MSKILYVSSAVQAALMSQIFIPELIDGFWKNYRPAGHGEVWRDVEVKVSENNDLGLVGFQAPRNYNFLALDFAIPNEAKLVAVARSVKPSSTFKSVKKELIELGRIVGGRLTTRDGVPVKLFRGNHKEGTVTVSSSKARNASNALGEAGKELHAALLASMALKHMSEDTPEEAAAKVKKPTVKKTVVKARPGEAVTVSKSAAGATVRRVAVN